MEVGPSAAPMMAMEAAIVDAKEHRGGTQREEDTELCGCAEDHQLRIRENRAEVNHRADTDEQISGNSSLLIPMLNKVDSAPISCSPFSSVWVTAPEKGNVHHDGAEAQGQQQGGFHVLFDGEIDQNRADQPHDDVLPCEELKVFVQCFQTFFLSFSRHKEKRLSPHR